MNTDDERAAAIQRMRELWRDGHHQLAQERAVGNVSAAEEIVAIGRRNGMSETEAADLMRGAVTTEFERLFPANQKSRSSRRLRRRTAQSNEAAREIQATPDVRRLGPGETPAP